MTQDFSVARGTLIAERYRIEGLIARGGMGAVHEATDVRLGRGVALKVLRAELTGDRTLIARFEREAKLAAQLAHPGIAQVLDFGATPEGLLYLVMERIQGETFGTLLTREGRIVPNRAAELVEQALGALSAAHQAGIVHRDLKPGNMMVMATGESREVVKLLDFGIAHIKASEAYTRLTQTGVILGTPMYMAPEQAMGEVVDARTDVYAMGVVLWCLLTCQKPFGGRDMAEIVEALLHVVPERADRVVPEVPSELAAIADKAMQKDPRARFQSASEMARALVEFRTRANPYERVSAPPRLSLAGAPQSMPVPAPNREPTAVPMSAPHVAPVVPPAGRSKVLWGAAALTIGVVGILAGVVIFLAIRFAISANAILNPASVAASPVCEQAYECCVRRGANTPDPEAGCIAMRSAAAMTCSQVLSTYGPECAPFPWPPVSAPPGAPSMAAPRTLTLARGFSPNPTTLTVTAGGPVAVSPLCAGNFPTEPNIVLSTTAPMELRVQTRSAEDTTLQIRFSDGRVLCNDDAVGINAMLDTTFPAGTHQIFIGTFMLRSAASAEVDIVDDTAVDVAGATNAAVPAACLQMAACCEAIGLADCERWRRVDGTELGLCNTTLEHARRTHPDVAACE